MPDPAVPQTTRIAMVTLPVAQLVSLVQVALQDRGFYDDAAALEMAREIVAPAIAASSARESADAR